jgi:hypothetical protein
LAAVCKAVSIVRGRLRRREERVDHHRDSIFAPIFIDPTSVNSVATTFTRRQPAGRESSLAVLGVGRRVSSIQAGYRTYGLECLCFRIGLQLRLLSELLRLASAEQFEGGFDTFLLAGVGVGEQFVDLEPAKCFAGHVAGRTLSVPL